MPDSIPQAEKVTWIIGDIHGMYDPLRALINHLDNEYLDKFIFTGDLIDHGPSSKAVLDLIIDLGDKAITLLGNHEYLLLETLYSEEFRNQWGNRIWEENGAQATVRSFGCANVDELRETIAPSYTEFLHNLRCFHVERFSDEATEINFLITHGGVNPKRPIAEQMAVQNYLEHNEWLQEQNIWIEDSFVWIRTDFFAADPQHWDGYVVIHGHTPTHLLRYSIFDFDEERQIHEPTQLYLRTHPDELLRVVSVDIDTGAAFGKRLTAVGLTPAALQNGWFRLQVLQLDLQQGYYRTAPFVRNQINLQAFLKEPAVS